MKVWHVLSLEGYERFRQSGIKRTYEEFVDLETFSWPYSWMIARMEKKLTEVTRPENAYPIWVWYQWNGIHQPKPSTAGLHGEAGKEMVILELEIPASKVLLSDYELWNAAISDVKIEVDEVKYVAFLDACESFDYKYPEDFRKEIEDSWELVFDFDFFHPDWNGNSEDKQIQGCTWELTWDQVVEGSEEHFTCVDDPDEGRLQSSDD
jgi:hypothetical protein